MAAQKGREMLIKVETAPGSGVFDVVGGMQTNSFKLAGGMTDVTDQASPGGWRELIAGAEIKTFSVSGSGVFKDSASEKIVFDATRNQSRLNYQLIMPGFYLIQGPFLSTQFDLSSDHNKEVKYSMTFESAGELTFTQL